VERGTYIHDPPVYRQKPNIGRTTDDKRHASERNFHANKRDFKALVVGVVKGVSAVEGCEPARRHEDVSGTRSILGTIGHIDPLELSEAMSPAPEAVKYVLRNARGIAMLMKVVTVWGGSLNAGRGKQSRAE
jgi:hypothetical protein